MKFDLHTHHERCGHAAGTIREYIESALALGLDMIGISDHAPYFASELDRLHPDTAMAISEFPRYVEEVLRMKEEYRGRIEVLLGIESDYFREHEALYRDVYSRYPLDYIIGSVHHSNGIPIFRKSRWEGMGEEGFLHEKEIYLETVQNSARSGLFDILGHMDALKRNLTQFGRIWTPVLEQTMKVLGECGSVIEINTSGAGHTCSEWYPSDRILELGLHYGVGVTFGSDAHRPENIGADFEEVRRRLKAIGFKQWIVFRQRKRVLVGL